MRGPSFHYGHIYIPDGDPIFRFKMAKIGQMTVDLRAFGVDLDYERLFGSLRERAQKKKDIVCPEYQLSGRGHENRGRSSENGDRALR